MVIQRSVKEPLADDSSNNIDDFGEASSSFSARE
jgi:hypothetical protein